MERIIFHIDVNSAYLSWTSVEQLRTGQGPDLRCVPAIIGGDQAKRHGVVLAKSLPAKSFGVRTGEPIATALKKCPDLLIAPPDHKLYARYSKRLMDFLREITPDLEQVSVDECFLDFTGIAHQYSSCTQAAAQIRDEIFARFSYTVNIGISSNKLLAKMASDFEKPGKIHTLFPKEIQEKMWPLPVEELYMAGRSSVQTLHKLGIRTIGDLAVTDPALLFSHLKSHGKMLHDYANGIDDAPVLSSPSKAKGIGNSITLTKDVTTREEAFSILRKLAEKVSARLRKSHVLAASLCVEIKYHTFTASSHQRSLDPPSDTTDGIYHNACILFEQLWNEVPIRLLGIRAGKLLPDSTPIQMSLFDPAFTKNEKQRKLDQALDSIRSRFGEDAIVRGSMLSGNQDHLKS